MRAKHNIEYVRKFFESNQCELLSENYENAKSLLYYRCSCGNTSKINFNNFQQGQRCRKCSYKKTADAKRLKTKDIAKKFKDAGCKLLSEFKNSQTKIDYMCQCGTANGSAWSKRSGQA